MADKNALGAIGLMLGAATIAVALIAGLAVSRHMTGQLYVDDSLQTSNLSPTLH